MSWEKDPDNPVIRPEPGTWKHDRCTSVTLAFKDDTCWFYHDGGVGFWWNGVPGYNSVGLLTCPESEFDGKTFAPFVCNPVLAKGRYADMDRTGMISPRVRLIDGCFFLYYCAVSYEEDSFVPGECPTWVKTIGLAISDDGFNFDKVSNESIVAVPEGYSIGNPMPFLHEGRWNLLFCMGPIDRSAGFGVYRSVSDDPRSFDGRPEPVLLPEQAGAWTAYSIAAPAFCFDAASGWYYMLFGGCPAHYDYPAACGLARSRDLRAWELHPANPIIHRGEPGRWDDGAIWITAFVKVGERYYAWYEGRSAGRDRSEEYSPGATKQIGLMTNDGSIW